MDATTLVSVEEYLRTSYSDGDREFIDGRVVERNMGTIGHGHRQTRIVAYLRSGVGIRVQVRPNRFRVLRTANPDIAVPINEI